jgi:UDP-hydrolysing UDP-N-acetyl-D-glucosamine 2-epimerase
MGIAIVTGSRADRGPLTPVHRALGGHWVHVEPSAASVATDMVIGTSAAMLAAMAQFSFSAPEIVVVLGDRFEVLGATLAAYLMNIPIAHLSGGDITEGSQDNSMRHAITKLAHLHFTTNDEASNYLVNQLGEEPWRVHTVGCPGVDNILTTQPLSLTEVTKRVGGGGGDYFLIGYQPATLVPDPLKEAEELLKALKQIGKKCIFTTLNVDIGGLEIQEMFREACLEQKWSMVDMDHALFLSVMRYCKVMIGNSSSGLYEAPTLRKPFVNVGERQKGRICADSVISCPAKVDQIVEAVQQALALDCTTVVNPYGDGSAATRIKHILQELNVDKQTLLTKRGIGMALHELSLVARLLEHSPSRSIH